MYKLYYLKHFRLLIVSRFVKLSKWKKLQEDIYKMNALGV